MWVPIRKKILETSTTMTLLREILEVILTVSVPKILMRVIARKKKRGTMKCRLRDGIKVR